MAGMTRILTACFLAALSLQLSGQEDEVLLLDSVTGHRLDTTEGTWNKDFRQLHQYNAFGRPTGQISTVWDSASGQWVGTPMVCSHEDCSGGWQLLFYDAGGNRVRREGYTWPDFQEDWLLDFREETTYNGAGIQISHAFWDYDYDEYIRRPGGLYVYGNGYRQYFDVRGKLTEYIRYNMDGNEDLWIPHSRDLHSYNDSGLIAERISQTWDNGDSLWKHRSRQTFAYDILGNETEQVGYEWSPDVQDWEELQRIAYTYDENGKLTEQMEYSRGNNEWSPKYRRVFRYDLYGYLYTSTSYYQAGNYPYYYWKEDSLKVCIHDAAGRELEYSEYRWLLYLRYWEGIYKETKSFDDEGQLIERTEYAWEFDLQDWRVRSRDTHSWDSLGNEIECTNWIWDHAGNLWLGDPLECQYGGCDGGRQVQSYDSLGNLLTINAFDWEPQTREWNEVYRLFYHREILGPHFVYIPDTAFLHVLIDAGVDTGGDGLISYEEAGNTGYLDVSSGTNIRDLTGLEAFVHLDTFICRDLGLEALPLGFNQNLISLDCSGNRLTQLDLTAMYGLVFLDCSQNKITALNLRDQGNLHWLDCSRNRLRNLNLSENSQLNHLDLGGMPDLWEVCVWTKPFPPGGLFTDTTGSPNIYFTMECELNGDRFEDNDLENTPAWIDAGMDEDHLWVTRGDEDWYAFFLSEDRTQIPLIITCQYQGAEHRIRMEILDRDGQLIDRSLGAVNEERIVFCSDQEDYYFLHLCLEQGDYCAYRLVWLTEAYTPSTEVWICSPEGSCGLQVIPVPDGEVLILDTLEVDLWSGDRVEKTIEISNHGPDAYYFFPALDCRDMNIPVNPALGLNGEGSYIRVKWKNSLDFMGPVTLEAWVRNGWDAPILSKTSDSLGFSLSITEDGKLDFLVAATRLVSESILERDRWQHVAASFDGQELCLYVNGVQDASCLVSGHPSAVLQDLYLGGRHPITEPQNFFSGGMDEVRIWTCARTPRDIRTHMYSSLTGDEDGLACYWPANRESDKVLMDHASGGNHGSFFGGVYWDDSAQTVVKIIEWPRDYGFIHPDSTGEFLLDIRAEDTRDGTYRSHVQLISGTALKPDVILPVRIRVTDAPSIRLSPDSLDLGEIELYRSVQRMIEVSNSGSMNLRIDSITSDLIGSRITPRDALIAPGETSTFISEVFMRFPGSFDGQYSFHTNDPIDRTVRVPIRGNGEDMNPEFVLLGSITDTVIIGYWKQYGKTFPNQSATSRLILKPDIFTYSLTGESNDLIPREDSIPGSWITTTLPEVCLLDPLENMPFDVILDAAGLSPGSYLADLILEWYDPVLHHGIIPVRMQALTDPQSALMPAGGPGFLIYPNPTHDRIMIHMNAPGTYTCQLIAMNGMLLEEKTFRGSIHTINLDGQAPGMYFIRICSPDSVETVKIIRLR
jgi:hypothetical protein